MRKCGGLGYSCHTSGHYAAHRPFIGGGLLDIEAVLVGAGGRQAVDKGGGLYQTGESTDGMGNKRAGEALADITHDGFTFLLGRLAAFPFLTR